MRGRRLFLFTKLSLFALVTAFAFSLIYYFPDLPPIFRLVIKKGVIKIADDEPTKVNDRFLKWFNRDPERKIPTSPNLIVSPADGVVQYVDVIDNKKHIVIEMRYTDVHVQRVPMDGEVIGIEGEGGKLPKGQSPYKYAEQKKLPFQKRTVFKTEIGEVAVRQITSLFASRVEVYLKIGEKAKRGQRLGRVLAGSTVVLELPLNIRILASKNQEVLAGETVLATY